MVEARQAAWAPELKRKLELMPASSALPALFFFMIVILSFFCFLVILPSAFWLSSLWPSFPVVDEMDSSLYLRRRVVVSSL